MILLIIVFLYSQGTIKIKNPKFEIHEAGNFVSIALEEAKVSFSTPGEPDIPWRIIYIPLGPLEEGNGELKIISKREVEIKKPVIPVPYPKEKAPFVEYRVNKYKYIKYPKTNFKNLGIGSIRGRKCLIFAYTPFIVEGEKLFVIEEAEIRIKKWKINRAFRKIKDHKIFKNDNGYAYIPLGESHLEFFERPFWFKIKTKEEGIYRITYEDLKNTGIEPSLYSVEDFCLFSLLGERLTTSRESLPLLNPLPYIIPFLFRDIDGNGYFNENDTLLFYSPGAKKRKWDGNIFSFQENPFTDTVIFWLALEGGGGKFMDSLDVYPSNWEKERNRCISYFRYEKNLINLGRRGLRWIGENLSREKSEYKKISFPMLLPDLADSSGRLKWCIVILRGNPDEVWVKYILNSDTLAQVPYPPPPYYNTAFSFTSYPKNLKENNTLEILIGKEGDYKDLLYLDYFETEYQRLLKGNKEIHAYDTVRGKVFYKLISPENGYLIDVTDDKNPMLLKNWLRKGDTIEFVLENDSVREFYFANLLKKPIRISLVPGLTKLRDTLNQADYIVITHKDLLPAIEDYIRYRRNKLYINDSLIKNAKIKVVTVQEIYDEYGFGSPDFVAIRNFLAYTFFFWKEPKPLYVLLAGNGNYDFKYGIGSFKNFVPSTEWGNVLDELQLGYYSYDQFYVKFDAPPNDPPDMIIGRIPAENISELRNYLERVKKYESTEINSPWRNRIIGVADDDGREFLKEVKQTLEYLPENMDFKDIYTSFYPSYEGEKFLARVSLFNALKKGCFLVFFYGHGSDHQVFDEKILVVPPDIPLLNFKEKMPIFFFGTCKPSYFNKTDRCMGEICMIEPNSGIATIGASTLIAAGSYQPVLHDFLGVLFDYKIHTLGECYFTSTLQKPEYILLGDPTLVCQIPSPSIDLTPQIPSVDTLMMGGIGKLIDTIQGEGEIYFFLLGQPVERVDTAPQPPDTPYVDTIYTRPNDIFRGIFGVRNGIYEAVFPLPKTMDWRDTLAKILIYYPEKERGWVGYIDSIYIKKFDGSVVDTIPPSIQILYKGKEIKDSTPMTPGDEIEIVLEDENGILIYGEEKIRIGIDEKLYDVTELFFNERDNFKRGKIKWILPENLQTGYHILTVLCYDNFGNSNSERKIIYIQKKKKETLKCLPFPNPAREKIYFGVETSVEGKIDLAIYTLRGRLIFEKKGIYINGGFNKIEWNGKDRSGNYVGNGIYIYKIKFESLDKSFKKTVKGKIAILK